MGTLRKLTIGQRITDFPGGTFNELVRRANKADQAGSDRPAGSPQSQAPADHVLLYWEGAEQIPPGSVVVLGNVMHDPTDEASAPFFGIRFRCELATSSHDLETEWYAITLDPIEAGGIGTGKMPLACWAQVTINDAADDAANLVDDSYLLSSASSGRVPIIWKQAGTGVKWAVVAVQGGGSDIIIGQATSTTSASTFAVDNIERITPGTLPSEPLTVNNTLSLDITDNQWVYAARAADGDWETWAGGGAEGPPGDGALFADFTATARSDRTSDTITGDIDQYWGGTPGSTTSVTVSKLSDHDVTIESGDKFRAAWDSDDEEWKLFWFSGLRLTVKGTVAGTKVSTGDGTFTLATPTLINGWRLPASTITVTNDPPIDAEVGVTVYARHNLSIGTNPLNNWDTGDGGNFLSKLRGIGGYNSGYEQVVGQLSDGNPDWLAFPTILFGVTSGAVTSSNSTFTVSSSSQVLICGKSPGSSFTANNHFGFDIDPGGKVLCIRSGSSSTWYCVQAECPS